jgi:DNA-binding NarL/FixJ family response regulator
MRVVLVDDSMIVREGLARLLEDSGITVTHRLGDSVTLDAVVASDPPDVVVLDLRMPPTFTDEGLRAAIRIREARPDVGLLLLSQHVEPAYAVQLVEVLPTGSGYLLKDRVTDIGVLVDALERIARGELVIDSTLVARMVARPRHADPLERLSAREHEVLALVAEGLTNEAIAKQLFVSERTVESHVARVLHKLDIDAAVGHRRVLAVLAYLRHDG